jgi:hypothetical protein
VLLRGLDRLVAHLEAQRLGALVAALGVLLGEADVVEVLDELQAVGGADAVGGEGENGGDSFGCRS